MNIITTEIEKAREIVAHCEERLCAKIERVVTERETEAEFRQAVEEQCAACQQEGNDVKDGETRVSCLEAENAVMREQIRAQQERLDGYAKEVEALKLAWFEALRLAGRRW